MHTDNYFEHLSVCDNDFEVMARVIAMIVPATDQITLSQHLRDKYTTIPSLLSTRFSSLRSDNSIGEAAALFLKYLYILLNRYTKSKLRNKDLISNISDLNHYLLTKMPDITEEQILIFLLDSKNFLIKEELMARGIVNEVTVHPASIIKKIIESDAASFILVHNHPSGDPRPSQDDISTTQYLSNICKQLSINFHDHVIVGSDSIRSMRQLSLI